MGCDVCSKTIGDGEGYLLTTGQVVSTPAYFKHAFSSQEEMTYLMGVPLDDSFKTAFARRMAAQTEPWLICDACIGLFAVDKAETRRYATRWYQSGGTFRPPGTGPAALSQVNLGDGKVYLQGGSPEAVALAHRLRATSPGGTAPKQSAQPAVPRADHGSGHLIIGIVIGVLVITAGVVAKIKSDHPESDYAAAEAQAKAMVQEKRDELLRRQQELDLALQEEKAKHLGQLAEAKSEADGEALKRQIDEADSRHTGRTKLRKTTVAALPSLSQSDIVRAMKAVQPRVKECYDQYRVPGIASVSISVSKGGQVAKATVTGKFGGTPSGACVEAAAKNAKFPPCEAMSFPWPFQLR
jgi:hypothetical protein